jgi:hypothetical protein
MSNNDLVRVEFGTVTNTDDQTIYKDLNAQSANIIGTAFKGPAFVPQVLFNRATLNGEIVRNTMTNVLGTHRQNFRAHLFDDYLCYPDSEAYDAASTWFSGGGEYAYFTRVLGIGSGVRSNTTGKMIGSGFNLSKNISSGTLDNKIGRNINANDGGDPGSVGFVVRKINEVGKSDPTPDDSTPTNNLDYFSELGLPDNSFILTDVYMFAGGVLPDFPSTISAENSTSYDTTTKNFTDITSQFLDASLDDTQRLQDVLMLNFNPYQSIKEEEDAETDLNVKKAFSISTSSQNIKTKENHYNDASRRSNQFFNNFINRGHVLYSKYPTCGLSAVENKTAILNTRQYPQDPVNYPDYNSFECEYQTAKTPWVTSQPINRSGFSTANNDNRLNIHDKVVDLFRLWSLDDGEIGNRFRIKINIKECGDTSYVKPNKVDPDFNILKADDDMYSSFDLYIFEYDPRVNAYIDLQVPDGDDGSGRLYKPVETYLDLNLNPDSDKYIGRVIGTKHTFYDFDSDMIKVTGKYENKSKYLRVEIHEDIEAKKYDTEDGPIQHRLLPAGFKSYPHIELNKAAFSGHYNAGDTPITTTQLDNIFVGEKVYHLPPQYALHYHIDDALASEGGDIQNNWGVLFCPSMLENTNNKFFLDRVQEENRESGGTGEEHVFPLSPHFYYSKYFLSGIQETNADGDLVQSLTKNVWIEENNYLNSFFHLEKIVFKNELDTDSVLISSFVGDERKDMSYKHSGRAVIGNDNYEYINLSEDNSLIWDNNNRLLKDKFRNKLSFDFFTYGGFDGVDLRDNDKRLLRNDAIIREIAGEEQGSETNGATYNSYKKAISIATDDAYTTADLLVVPGIKEIPLIRQCVNACEDSRTQDMFFIGDVSGACSSVDITFANQTIVLVEDATPDDEIDNNVYSNKPVKVSKGVMGNYTILNSNLNNSYRRDTSKTRAEGRFILTDKNVPLLGDVQTFYSYKNVVKSQFNNIVNLWPTFFIESRYFLPVLGDVIATNADSELDKKIGPETVALGLIAKNGLRDSLVNSTTPSFLENFNVSMRLLDDVNLNARDINFETNSDRAKKAGINLLYNNTEADTFKLLSQNTAYVERGSLFKDQGVVRTIQQIKKRIMFDMFLNQQFVEGGFFFGQNSNLTNMYQKLEIQLNNILTTFIEEGLITDYKVRIPQSDDDQTMLDMQNYILRGNIILQMGISDTIDITLDEILQDLSLTADPVNGAVLVPRIP